MHQLYFGYIVKWVYAVLFSATMNCKTQYLQECYITHLWMSVSNDFGLRISRAKKRIGRVIFHECDA